MFSPRPFQHLTGIICLAAALLSLSPAAEAHEFGPERQVLLQVFPEHLDLLIFYLEAPGLRSGLFGAQFGPIGGETEGILAPLTQRAVLPRMLDGLRFEVVGEQPATGEPEIRVQRQQGRLMAAAFIRYQLAPLAEDQPRTVLVTSADRSFLTTSVQIYGGQGLELLENDSGIKKAELHRNQELRATFVAPALAKPNGAGPDPSD